MDSELVTRITKIEERLARVEKRQRKTAKKRQVSLKEKFDTHDRAQTLLRQFEVIVGGVPHENVWFCEGGNQPPLSLALKIKEAPIKDLKQIVKELSKLVDYALGVQFP